MAVKETKTDESYTCIVSDGKKQSTLVMTKEGIQVSVGATYDPSASCVKG